VATAVRTLVVFPAVAFGLIIDLARGPRRIRESGLVGDARLGLERYEPGGVLVVIGGLVLTEVVRRCWAPFPQNRRLVS
jgi:hypothetical protein